MFPFKKKITAQQKKIGGVIMSIFVFLVLVVIVFTWSRSEKKSRKAKHEGVLVVTTVLPHEE